MYSDRRHPRRVKNSLPSAFNSATGLNSPGDERSSDFAMRTIRPHCQQRGITFSDQIRFIIERRIISSRGHILYTKNGMPLIPGAFLLRFFFTASNSFSSSSSEVLNSNFGFGGRGHPGGGPNLVVRSSLEYRGAKWSCASDTEN